MYSTNYSLYVSNQEKCLSCSIGSIKINKAMQSLNIDESEKTKFNKKVSAAEDIAIESTENLIHVSKMLTKLQEPLSQMAKRSDRG